MENAYKGHIAEELEIIYDKIVERFPAGRMTAYIINNRHPEKTYIIEQLETFVAGFDSDGKYSDEQSKSDARSFIDLLLLNKA